MQPFAKRFDMDEPIFISAGACFNLQEVVADAGCLEVGSVMEATVRDYI